MPHLVVRVRKNHCGGSCDAVRAITIQADVSGSARIDKESLKGKSFSSFAIQKFSFIGTHAVFVANTIHKWAPQPRKTPPVTGARNAEHLLLRASRG